MTGPSWTTPEGWGPPPPAGGGAPSPGYGPPPGAPGPGGPPYGQPQHPRPYGQAELKPGVVPLRPLGLGEMLDGAVGVIRRYPRVTLGMAAAVAVVSALVNLLMTLTVLRPIAELDPVTPVEFDSEAFQASIGAAAVGGLVAALVALLASALLTGVLTTVVGKAVLGHPLDVREAWQAVRPRLLKLVGVSLLVSLSAGLVAGMGVAVAAVLVVLAGGGGALIGVPLGLVAVLAAVYVAIRLSLAPCALMLERTGVRESLRRSWALVKGDWWRVFGIILLTAILAGFVSLLLQLPFQLLGGGLGADPLSARALIFSSLGGIVASTLVQPFSAGVTALLYVDRRMRAEGLDVDVAAAATRRP